MKMTIIVKNMWLFNYPIMGVMKHSYGRRFSQEYVIWLVRWDPGFWWEYYRKGNCKNTGCIGG